MKTKLFTIAFTIITAFSLTAIYLPEASAQSAETCKVKKNNASFFIEATEKTVKLKKGTLIQYIVFGNQGLAVVKAKIGKNWVRGEIKDDLLQCPPVK